MGVYTIKYGRLSNFVFRVNRACGDDAAEPLVMSHDRSCRAQAAADKKIRCCACPARGRDRGQQTGTASLTFANQLPKSIAKNELIKSEAILSPCRFITSAAFSF